MSTESCPSAAELQAALDKAEAQRAENQEALKAAGYQGQQLLAEEQALRQSLEACRLELAEHLAEERSHTPVSEPLHLRPKARNSELERIQLRNQLMAEELEEHEKETVNISGAPTGHGSLIGVQRTAASRRRGQSTSEDGRARLQELCQELADAKSAEEDAAAQWVKEERRLQQEVLEAEASDAAMMQAMRQKLDTMGARNEKLKEELRSEEVKTRGKTFSLEAAVGQLRAELRCWGSASASPSSAPELRRPSSAPSAGTSEVWSGWASESSSGSRGSCSSHGSCSQTLRAARQARRRPTTTFKPLQQVVSLNEERQIPSQAQVAGTSRAVQALRSSVSGLMDDALLRMGELMQDSGEGPKAGVKKASEPGPEQEANVSEASVQPVLSDLWKASSSHRESASAALAHFGALLQQQVNSAAELAGTAMPSVSSRS